MDLIILAAIGVFAGLIAGLVGLAGGIVVVPALTWVYGPHALHAAIVASWFAVLFNSIGAVSKQWRIRSAVERAALIRAARWYLAGAVVVTPIIACLASGSPRLLSAQVVGVLQLCLAVVMLIPVSEAARARRDSPVRDASFGGLIAAVSTLVGLGGGTYTIAYFVYGAGARFRDAIATANLAGFAVGALSVAGYLSTLLMTSGGGGEPLPAGLSSWGIAALVLAGAAAAPLGVAMSQRIATRWLRQTIIVLLVISAARLVLG